MEWLTDNGSCYRANETRQFARMLGLEPKNTAVRSPESNGIAESFVKTIKRDYISIMPKPDGLTAAKNLAEAFANHLAVEINFIAIFIVNFSRICCASN
ncbi:putative transposase [Shigella boydii 3594-74]|uniref:IS2 orfB n=4 Tax=Shigella TaxID=620 RepID=A0A6N3QIL0_SHIFL|nr:IS2 ORF2 [Shigella boydii Sb227]EFW59306.1 IS2 orfB [Shigella flexneri CDC 796-83]EGJ01893.1 putative transposase [Shigella boydii 3594-74]EIQ11490.1 putative transposase [Shigella flexneri CCH060]EIQ44296.1 putative transposase [Shigella boydii 4444-74]EJZ66610.1 putative transposase [Shigella flexneri 1485-80]